MNNYQAQQDLNSIIGFATSVMVLGFMVGMTKDWIATSSSKTRHYLPYSEMVIKLGNKLNTDEGVAELRREMLKAPNSSQGVYWHFTPIERLSSIKRSGLIVGSPIMLEIVGEQSRNAVFLVPDRYSCILFVVSQVDLGIIGPGNYAILSVKLPTNIKVYKDPESQAFFGGVYTKENIPPKHITTDEIISVPEESEWLGYI